ncbi:MAG: hypothetical protein ACRDXB_17660, partial [Actinomycetes bacterium]
MIPDETIDRAVAAFYQALSTHMDYAGASCRRADDWVSAPVPAVVEALLLRGWVPPQDEAGDADDLESAETFGQRQVPSCRSRRPMY